MSTRPNPDGWVGGSEDFEFVRTLDGHIGFNPFTDDQRVSDTDMRRNSRDGFAQADLAGAYDPAGHTEASEGESLTDP